jgi:glutamine cyclotransferase
MRRFCIALGILCVSAASAQDGPYKVLKTAKVGGAGGFDYVYADSAARKLYVARSGTPGGRITVFNLDTLEPAGEIAEVNAHGAVVDSKNNHGFASSKPVTMFDSKTLAVIKKIDVEGSPDGMLQDNFNNHVYILSHRDPNVTVLDAKDGSVLGTIDLGGAPEQAVSDGKGHIYIDIEDKDNIAVVDAKTMKVTAHYDISSKGGTCAGLAMDVKNGILFAACRKPQMMVILKAADGKILEALPLGAGTDGASFNPKTMEAFSSQGDGTFTVIKENSPTSFVVEQTVTTPQRAKTHSLDEKTGKLFLISAEYQPAPAPPPGGRAGRGSIVPDSFSITVVGK